jgi:hypothetical protein
LWFLQDKLNVIELARGSEHDLLAGYSKLDQ